MSCNIVTGRQQASTSGSNVNDDVPSSYLFDAKSTNLISRPIFIDNCQVVKFSTFGLPDNVCLKFHRVFVGGGVPPQSYGCLCSADMGKKASILYSEIFKIDCKEVKLCNCTGVLLLSIPGTYVLELSDKAYLGQFIAMAEYIDCCCLPSGLMIGNIGKDGYIGVQ